MNINTPVPTLFGDDFEKHRELWTRQIAALHALFGDVIELVQLPRAYPTDVPIVFVKPVALIRVLAHMKSDPDFDYGHLSDLTATDEEASPRFHVVYNLVSRKTKARIRVKSAAEEGQSVPTAIELWPAANWAEREVWDMFGISFEGHPDLRRILMDVRWDGHPLRKDYPVRGYQFFPSPEPVDPSLLG
jgi:NADH/F420H2 dehydrogenase subunit C